MISTITSGLEDLKNYNFILPIQIRSTQGETFDKLCTSYAKILKFSKQYISLKTKTQNKLASWKSKFTKENISLLEVKKTQQLSPTKIGDFEKKIKALKITIIALAIFALALGLASVPLTVFFGLLPFGIICGVIKIIFIVDAILAKYLQLTKKNKRIIRPEFTAFANLYANSTSSVKKMAKGNAQTIPLVYLKDNHLHKVYKEWKREAKVIYNNLAKETVRLNQINPSIGPVIKEKA
ncbi:hypothetical protein BN1013_02039 [Candidatus Rubidus massiliensis]|nr:hypothetical protein BN1013_02039 [Candidatus Rubidus massiliensis]